LSAFTSLIFTVQSDRVFCEALAEAEETVDDLQLTTKTVVCEVRVEAGNTFHINILT